MSDYIDEELKRQFRKEGKCNIVVFFKSKRPDIDSNSHNLRPLQSEEDFEKLLNEPNWGITQTKESTIIICDLDTKNYNPKFNKLFSRSRRSFKNGEFIISKHGFVLVTNATHEECVAFVKEFHDPSGLEMYAGNQNVIVSGEYDSKKEKDLEEGEKMPHSTWHNTDDTITSVIIKITKKELDKLFLGYKKSSKSKSTGNDDRSDYVGSKYDFDDLKKGKYKIGERRIKQKSLYCMLRIKEKSVTETENFVRKINEKLDEPLDEDELQTNLNSAEKYFINKIRPEMYEELENNIKLENKTYELLLNNNDKETLEQLKKYAEGLGVHSGDAVLKPIIKYKKKQIEREFNNHSKNNEEEEESSTVKCYNVGKNLIQNSAISKNNNEQVVIKVEISERPYWIDIFSPLFNQLIRIDVQKEFGEIFSNNIYETAIKNLHAEKLLYESKISTVYKRCALTNRELFFDLEDIDGTKFKISEDEILKIKENDEELPIFLRKHNNINGLSALPLPIFGNRDAIDELVKLFRISDEDKIVFKSHLVVFYLSDFPIPISVFHGEQGSAKTTVSSGMKAVHDPTGENAMSLPDKVDDLAVILANHDTSNFDNLDNFAPEISQFLCRVITGTSYAKRLLFSDGSEFELILKSKITLNGISPSVNQPDLLERSIFYELSAIKGIERMTDDKFKNKLKELTPELLGQVFTTIQKALKIYKKVEDELEGGITIEENGKSVEITLPRMATFAVWGEAISRVLGNEDLLFLKKYNKKIETSNIGLRDEYPIMDDLLEHIESDVGREPITITKLFKKIVNEDSKDDRLPKDAKRLGKQIRHLGPTIRSFGYETIIKINTVRPKSQTDHKRGVTLVYFIKIDENALEKFNTK